MLKTSILDTHKDEDKKERTIKEQDESPGLFYILPSLFPTRESIINVSSRRQSSHSHKTEHRHCVPPQIGSLMSKCFKLFSFVLRAGVLCKKRLSQFYLGLDLKFQPGGR